MRVAVAGAGLAGLAAGCELADLGHGVTLYERRPWAGGKTYSFKDDETGAIVDNGQHVFMACTTEYIAFLRRLGTLNLARRQKRLRVRVYGREGERANIVARGLPAPLHLAQALLRYTHLTARERLRAASLMARIRLMSEARRASLTDVAFSTWLTANGQDKRLVERFWDFLLLPTLNCRSKQASTSDALFVIREGFLASSRSSAIGIPGAGLSQLHVEPAVRYIEMRGGRVLTGRRVRSLMLEDGRVAGVVTADGAERFDATVCALPPWDVAPLLPPEWSAREPFASLGALQPSPIINLHLWFERPVADFAFAAFIDSDLQWVFNRSRLDLRPEDGGQHLVVSLSGADDLMALDKNELANLLVPQLRRALHFGDEVGPVRVLAIKEPGATFIPAPGLVRPGNETVIENLVLAGAYTATGWPATMESAIRSGLAAARSLHARRELLQSSPLHAMGGR